MKPLSQLTQQHLVEALNADEWQIDNVLEYKPLPGGQTFIHSESHCHIDGYGDHIDTRRIMVYFTDEGEAFVSLRYYSTTSTDPNAPTGDTKVDSTPHPATLLFYASVIGNGYRVPAIHEAMERETNAGPSLAAEYPEDGLKVGDLLSCMEMWCTGGESVIVDIRYGLIGQSVEIAVDYNGATFLTPKSMLWPSKVRDIYEMLMKFDDESILLIKSRESGYGSNNVREITLIGNELVLHDQKVFKANPPAQSTQRG